MSLKYDLWTHLLKRLYQILHEIIFNDILHFKLRGKYQISLKKNM